ncbi:MAG: GNAT family N-acetyltransferase [Melioribacteraceae bacterium]|nr:GNAT family N-acetyltransferase [Melioribacteraceae bacterium]MCF8354628.1 GNAT family N-acetyltransferase [Melioribacteraceae bacterium]MCF8395016.1 GNAT family N-acetyltransferase [Melioribacteraceae bacterium]MCF8418880.1 GNAT family N-acetyltransferase [Melioribacteraceae bacterium]
MEVIRYTDDWKEKWDEFVLESNNGTMFHMQKFFEYHQPGKFSWDHLIVLNDDQIKAVLPGTLKDGMFESPVGASYGSLVTKDIYFSETMEIVSSILDYGKKNNFKEFLLTPAPIIYEEYQNQNLDFAMLWQGFNFSLHYISSAIKLDKDRDILSRFSSTVRRNVRKTFRDFNLRVEVNDKYDEFYPILLDNKSKHDVKPTHSYDDLLKLKELMPDRLKLFMVYYKDKPIAGSLMFYPNINVALCFYNMLLYDYAEYKPIQRVMYEVVKDATENNYKYVDIGVSQDTKADNPMTPSMSLIEFKEKFDAKTVMRNTFHITL